MRFLTVLFLLATVATAAAPYPALPVLNGTKQPTGELVGQVEFGGRRVAAMLHRNRGAWLLALKTGANRLSDLAPAVRGTLLDDVGLSAPVLVLSDRAVTVDLSAAARRFFGVAQVDLERGMNLIAVATPRGRVAAALGKLGVSIPRVVLTGVMLRDFDGDALSAAKKNGTLARALRRGTMLKAHLPSFRPRLPRGMAAGSAYFYVTGEPGVGVGFTLTMNKKRFEARLGVRKNDANLTEAMIFASARGRWAHAFGIRGFHLDGVKMVMSLDAAQRLGVGLKANMAIGSRTASIGGKILLHAVTGAPAGGAFEGRLSRLGSADLIRLLDTRSTRRPGRRFPLPNFELRDLYLRIAPGGGDAALGIKSGFGIRGRLYASGRNLASVAGEMDESPMLRLKGRLGNFSLGAVSLTGAMVDVRMSARGDDHFLLRGDARLFGSRKLISIRSRPGLYDFRTIEKIGGVYEADVHYTARTTARPSWSVDVKFKNHLSRTLERDVSRRAQAWANQVKRDFGKIQSDLRKAQAKVNRLNREIGVVRNRVVQERRANWAKIQRIKNRIDWLNRAIAAREKKIGNFRSYVAKLKRIRDRTHKAWRKAVAATKRAKVWDKPKYKAIEAKRWTDYTTAKASYDLNAKHLAKLVRSLDPKLNVWRAERNVAKASYATQSATYRRIMRIPVDADPRVAGLITARASATVALQAASNTARGLGNALQGAGRVTAWAARNNGRILMLDEARFSARLDSMLRGNRIALQLKMRVLGKRKNVTLQASAASLRSGNAFRNLWSMLKKHV